MMDIGIFKASRLRLILWLALPPVVAIGVGLSTYTLRLRSQWKLERTRKLAEVLPRLVESRDKAQMILNDFQQSAGRTILSEDQMISYLQETAQRTGFQIDSLKVDRRGSGSGIPMLRAHVFGAGNLDEITLFMGDVSSSQTLLTEKQLKLSQSRSMYEGDQYSTEMEFELLLFSSTAAAGGGAQ